DGLERSLRVVEIAQAKIDDPFEQPAPFLARLRDGVLDHEDAHQLDDLADLLVVALEVGRRAAQRARAAVLARLAGARQLEDALEHLDGLLDPLLVLEQRLGEREGWLRLTELEPELGDAHAERRALGLLEAFQARR